MITQLFLTPQTLFKLPIIHSRTISMSCTLDGLPACPRARHRPCAYLVHMLLLSLPGLHTTTIVLFCSNDHVMEPIVEIIEKRQLAVLVGRLLHCPCMEWEPMVR